MRRCDTDESAAILATINDGALAYRGSIPADCWHDPYMSLSYLHDEMANGVQFWAIEGEHTLDGVMGIQQVADVTLIRHAYTRSDRQGQGIGSQLLSQLRALTSRPILVGTWRAASWAVGFYEHHGFQLTTDTEKELLLCRYWRIPEKQIANSVVLSSEDVTPLIGI